MKRSNLAAILEMHDKLRESLDYIVGELTKEYADYQWATRRRIIEDIKKSAEVMLEKEEGK